MKMKNDVMYRKRREFFNEHAEEWLDMWYRNRVTGIYDKHGKDFERLFSLLPLKAGDHVLDVGCGTGILVPFILERITSTGILYELDFAEKMLDVNRCLHRSENIRFVLADAEDPQLDDNSCDVVVCFSCFPHLYDKEKALAALARILKPRGVLIVSHFDSSEGINKHHASCHAVMHDHLPDEKSMRSLLRGAGFDIARFMDEPGFYFISSSLSEGQLQEG